MVITTATFSYSNKILDPDPNYPLNPGSSAYVYISTKNSLANYDRFAEHRINGLKAVFVLELLFGFNYVFGMQIRISIIFIFR